MGKSFLSGLPYVFFVDVYQFVCVLLSFFVGAPVAQWVKCWPTDLAVVSSSPARGEDIFNRKRGSIAHSLSLPSAHRPDMTEILLKRT